MRLVLGVGAAALLAAAVMGPAVAIAHEKQIFVLESTAPGVKAGKAYSANDMITVPAGASVRLVLPSGKTQTLKGPLSKTVLELGEGQETHGSVAAWLKNLLQTGGSQERTPGATRSARPRPAAPQFSWTDIPVGAEGTFCVQKSAQVRLHRTSSSTAERVTVADPKGLRSEAEFKAGSETAPWPAALPASGPYTLTAGTGAGSKITINVLEKLPAEDDTLAELANRQCKYQFEAWVKQNVAR